ncbi:YibE/F family protein [Candidatus Falkowbacteria bacterium]|nr:YibE/F family protein [Candidatus Falkowbacteria bacterium]
MRFKLFIILLFSFFILPLFCLAQSDISAGGEVFKAKVLEITDQRELIREDGSINIQQNIKLIGLSGSYKHKEILIEGISDIEVISANTYKKGDKVFVTYDKDAEGNDYFFITDYVRSSYLFYLSLIFALVILFVGKKRGLKALISLILSFIIIIKFIVPQILAGQNPLLISVAGCFIILALIIYVTEGFNRKSHLALLSVFFSLLITIILSCLFTNLSRLTGLANEDAMFLIGATTMAIDFKGLLLAGILIGTIGVLDDIIIAQIEAVRQIREANPSLVKKKIFSMAYEIGNTHLGAIVNTLFLTYAGVSLPLLLLFSLHQEPFLTFSQVINNELIATEIVRALVGSIGVALSLPIATFFGVYFYKK